jgi:FtsP/CotA-like multicopper oxidase with cupredoxin domain
VQPVSRRTALQLAAAGAVAAVGGAVGLYTTAQARTALGAVTGSPLKQPPELVSSNGLLRVQLTARSGPTSLAGRTVRMLSFNGTSPGPTLRVRRGDRVELRLVNRLADPTNLHTHGLHVSPAGNGDNALVTVEPGSQFDYVYEIPEDHPPGVYWYHPHHHGMVADQVFGGLFGAIVVDDARTSQGVTERVLIISDISFDGSSVRTPSPAERLAGREGELLLVNGQAQPVLRARPGATERWRVVNACTSRYLRLAFPGASVTPLRVDSGLVQAASTTDTVDLLPGNRVDLRVVVGDSNTKLTATTLDRSFMGMSAGHTGTEVIAAVAVSGSAAPSASLLAATDTPADLRRAEPAHRRQLTLSMSMGGMGMGGGLGGVGGMGGVVNADSSPMGIDGQGFDPSRIDQEVKVGDVEEWTLLNASPMDHPFHLHVWPMQVLEVGGRTVDPVIYRDVVNVPAHSWTTVRIAFDRYAGTAVYHCHILDHEDLGMMGTVRSTR